MNDLRNDFCFVVAIQISWLISYLRMLTYNLFIVIVGHFIDTYHLCGLLGYSQYA